MYINYSIEKFLLSESASFAECLQKIEKNKKGIVFVITEKNILLGVITDGDIRRRLSSSSNLNLETALVNFINKDFVSRSIHDSNEVIANSITSKFSAIPLINSNNQIVAIAFDGTKQINIGNIEISNKARTFIIAEIGNNHNGDINLAKRLVDEAILAGADCVKFQMRDMSSLYKSDENHNLSSDLGDQYTRDLLDRFQLSNEELLEVFRYSEENGILALCTPWDMASLNVLESFGMKAYKVASADLTNFDMLAAIAETKKPMICSTGMSSEEEIVSAISFLEKSHAQFILLHCNSTYPTPNRDVNLRYLKHLQSINKGRIVGYSGHERGFLAPVVSVALGAKVIEKHFTLDKEMEGNDHRVSLTPNEFKDMVSQIRLCEEFLGSDSDRVISQGESLNRETLAKSLVIKNDLKKGSVITRSMVEIKSPGQGLQPCEIERLVGKKAKHDFKKGDYFFESDISQDLTIARNYKFKRPFGIPVRYHDFETLSSKTNLDFVEFHLSYNDLEIDINNIFTGKYDFGFSVHCPELFGGDHLLNLCSFDSEYRQRSISEIRRVIGITKKIQKFFPKTKVPKIITNVGGFSSSNFVDNDLVLQKYEILKTTLDLIDTTGVEILIQTMPPFPWHFGGQSFHNLFVNPDQIKSFCKETGYRVCLDVSHSQMACSFYKWDMGQFIEDLLPYIGYLHIVDSIGVDGEGVQIGNGDVDFQKLAEKLNEIPSVEFIPEIWQGHKEYGSGFWNALEFLEEYL